MGQYDISTDAPGMLRAESLNISLKFDRTGPTTGRISWNVPAPAVGCGSLSQAYNGMIITIDTTPTAVGKIPVNGTLYNSDPTVDYNLFAGDKLGTANIVGAFYDDVTTTFFDVTGLTPNTPYYITGFPVDNQRRYFIEGVHAYSMDYLVDGSSGTSGTQIVILNSEQSVVGVDPNAFTELMPGITYEFQIQVGLIPRPNTPVDPVYGAPAPMKYTISVAGANSTHYVDLVAEINKQLSLISNPTQGPYAPNTNAFYWNATLAKLYQWNGSANVELPVIIQDTTPTVLSIGTYWLNPTTFVLKLWNGSAWTTPTIITSVVDPQNPIADTSYWFNGTSGYVWNGTSWCNIYTTISTADPSTINPVTSGAFWYDTEHTTLYKWDSIFEMWVVVDEVKYHEDPTNLTDGAYWFNESANTLNAWNIPNPGWNQQINVAVSEIQPGTPAPGKFWYNPTSQTLKQYNGSTLVWDIVEVISYPQNPITRTSCDLWWDTTLNQLKVWDSVNSIWKSATTFYQQATDPSVKLVMVEGSLWFNSTLDTLNIWKNNCFVVVNYINYPTDPTAQLPVGVVWYNPTSASWKAINGSFVWANITPVISESDLANLPIGSYWFNTTNSSVQMWNGVAWISVVYSTSSPAPTVGSTWFNSTMNKLLLWNGTVWEIAPVSATVELTGNGNLLFTDTSVNSMSYIQLADITLFQSLGTRYNFYDPKPGTDSVSSQPSYDQLGIGTDGTNDQRLTLMTEIRYELGYPAVDVEVEPQQLDYAITRALNELRAHSGLAYKRGFMFMQVSPETQRYVLSNKIGGMDKIVEIMGIYRLTSSFLSSAHGAGLYGQVVLQQLYNMGTFDLLSYHIMTEYTKTMEQLFAAKLTFTWNEQTRELWIHHRFPMTEPYVSMEVSMERTEQEIMSDRYARPWIRRYATAVTRLMLAETRGKYASLPGAGGNITLNANDLRMAAKEAIDECMAEIFDYVADRPEDWGMASTMCFG
ncbi:hypothetical protein M0R04_07080 [Candidatus Dojkabacteria bacterium]|jgi:hypothetical protein|nr:hypothetical protein [Candidatus Dojkabacteria bacterium]